MMLHQFLSAIWRESAAKERMCSVHLLVVVDDLAPIWPVTVLIITSISIKSIIIASHEMSKSTATLTKASTFISHELMKNREKVVEKNVVLLLLPINMKTKY